MIPKRAEEGLREVLQHAFKDELQDILYTMTSKTNTKLSKRELIDTIIVNAKSPRQVLSFKNLMKSAIVSYLRGAGELISEKRKKCDLIEICLQIWGINEERSFACTNNDGLRTEEDIKREIDGLKRKRENDVQKVQADYETAVKRLKTKCNKDAAEIDKHYEANRERLEEQLRQVRETSRVSYCFASSSINIHQSMLNIFMNQPQQMKRNVDLRWTYSSDSE